MSTFLLLRDYDSLDIMTDTADGDGRVYDLYNTSINHTINGEHNVTFNILPYLDVYRIGYPNVMELDGDFFQVARVEKTRDSGVAMRVDGEHISYELNKSVLDFEEDDNEELSYEGYPEEIASEMIAGTRFYIHPDLDIGIFPDEIEFTTTQKGVRNRLLELADFCGVEIVFYRYSINFVSRIGSDKGISLEVGKNIRGLTEVIETQVNGRLVKSYEVDIVDLNYIRDTFNGDPEELFNIEIGDTLRVIDGQFGINYVDRVKSISYDPFKAALPQIELVNRIPSTANTSNIEVPVVVGPGGGGGGELVALVCNDTRLRIDSHNSSMNTTLDGVYYHRDFTPANLESYSNRPLLMTGYITIESTFDTDIGLRIFGEGLYSRGDIFTGTIHIHSGINTISFAEIFNSPVESNRFMTSLNFGISLYAINTPLNSTVIIWENKAVLAINAVEPLSGGNGGGGSGGGDNYDSGVIMEFGRIELMREAVLNFGNGPYNDVLSVTTGISGQGSDSMITIETETIEDDDGYYTGLRVYANNSNNNEWVTVNIQAVCANYAPPDYL